MKKLYHIKSFSSYLKVLFCIVVVIVFWSALIGGSPFYMLHLYNKKVNNLQLEETAKVDKISSPLEKTEQTESQDSSSLPVMTYFDNNRSYKAFPPAERSIILRMDDIQGYLWRELVINLTDTVLNRNLSITLAVIPDRTLGDDTIIQQYLIQKSKNPRLELAQHGYNHTEHYDQLDEKAAYHMIELGHQEMLDDLRVDPVTFIPPFNEYNKDTINALLKLNFKIISGGVNDFSFDFSFDTDNSNKDNSNSNQTNDINNDSTSEADVVYDRSSQGAVIANASSEAIINNQMFIIPFASIGYNTETKYSDQTELIPVNTILNDCKISLDKRNICVIMIHPQDYSIVGKGTMNNTKYAEFIHLLDELKSLNARSITFKDLIRYMK